MRYVEIGGDEFSVRHECNNQISSDNDLDIALTMAFQSADGCIARPSKVLAGAVLSYVQEFDRRGYIHSDEINAAINKFADAAAELVDTWDRHDAKNKK